MTIIKFIKKAFIVSKVTINMPHTTFLMFFFSVHRVYPYVVRYVLYLVIYFIHFPVFDICFYVGLFMLMFALL